MSTVRQNIDRIEHALHAVANAYELQIGRPGFNPASIEEAVATQLAACEALRAEISPRSTTRVLSRAEKLDVLVRAVASLAIKDASVILRPTAMHGALIEHVEPEHRDAFVAIHPGELATHVTFLPPFRARLLAEFNVSVAHFDDGIDGGWLRATNNAWLTSHAAIRAFVADHDSVPGSRCRFCRAQEPHNSAELRQISPPDRNPLAAAHLWRSTVVLHQSCIEPWRQWVAIAESYPDVAAAEAADVAAGRTPTTVLPALPAPVQDVPEPSVEESWTDQRRSENRPDQRPPSNETPKEVTRRRRTA